MRMVGEYGPRSYIPRPPCRFLYDSNLTDDPEKVRIKAVLIQTIYGSLPWNTM